MALSISEFDGFVVLHETDCDETPTEYAIGPCRVYKIEVFNKDTGLNYLKLYDASEITFGTTEPGDIFPVEAGDGTNWGFLCVDYLDKPRIFTEGLSFGASDGRGKDLGTGPGANEVLVIFHVKRGVA
jgi:hypothetical protein